MSRPTSSHEKPRIAVVSPFLDKSYGTERIVIEWIGELCDDFEIWIYSQQVKDVDLSKATWRHVPKLPGPHLLNYAWWFVANHLWRACDSRFRGRRHDVVFTPGINCIDADAVSVHIVFAEFLRRIKSELAWAKNPIWFWPRLLHRKAYYRLIILLERIIFTNPRTQLILTSPRSAAELRDFYGRQGALPVICAGIDHATFNATLRAKLRDEARRTLGLTPDRFALLLIGNDWQKKGIRVLFDTLVLLRDLPVDLLAVGREDASRFQLMVRERALDTRVFFLPARRDVEFYYAAVDAYTGPSLEDTFALPAFEAMACGLPVIMSARAGAADFLTHGVDALVLHDPTNAAELAKLIRRLFENHDFCLSLGAKAAETVRQYTWNRSGHELGVIFQDIIRRKRQLPTQSATRSS